MGSVGNSTASSRQMWPMGPDGLLCLDMCISSHEVGATGARVYQGLRCHFGLAPSLTALARRPCGPPNDRSQRRPGSACTGKVLNGMKNSLPLWVLCFDFALAGIDLIEFDRLIDRLWCAINRIFFVACIGQCVGIPVSCPCLDSNGSQWRHCAVSPKCESHRRVVLGHFHPALLSGQRPRSVQGDAVIERP